MELDVKCIGLDWIRTQEKIIGLDWTGIKKYLDRTWTQFLESKKLWTGFGFGKVQSSPIHLHPYRLPQGCIRDRPSDDQVS